MSLVMKRELAKQKKMLHPNSRKILAIAKKSKKASSKEQLKQVSLIKHNLIREKMLWMVEHMVPNVCPYTPQLTAELLEKYIARHDEEIRWIEEKNKLPGRKNRRHATREDILKMCRERELDEYNGCGIEIPNILNSTQCEMLRKWDGDVRYLPNFVFRRFGKRHVDHITTEQQKNSKSTASSNQQLDNTCSNTKNIIMQNDEQQNVERCTKNITLMDTI